MRYAHATVLNPTAGQGKSASASLAAVDPSLSARPLPGNPRAESGNGRMRRQCLQRVVMPFQALVVERGMNVLVTRATDADDALKDLGAREQALVSFVAVAGARDEVIYGDIRNPSSAELAAVSVGGFAVGT